jgi:hypothetical protein
MSTSTAPGPEGSTPEAAATEAYDEAFGDWRTTTADAQAFADHAATAVRSCETRQDYAEFMAARYPDRDAT